uniref:Membrane protein YkvI n=1 Tax=uncultured bacterium fosmid pJB77G10 TaxID=1478069 RepID=A0A0H3U829_9BACT|nr:hypothetical protein [uncultured bacterium fosmid pJB77G10]
MTTTKKKSWMRWLIPGFIFQSVVIGGGYGTGAEIKEYFLTQGFVGGLLGTLVTLVIWAIVCAATFEFSRVFKTFDYQSMMKKLLGKGAFLYEICYIVLLLIVLGVINATASSMITGLTGAPGWIGIAILSVGIIVLVVAGSEWIERVLSFWSYALYAVYIIFMIMCFTKFGDAISAEFSKGQVESSWFLMGAKYSFYNLGIVPALLFTVRNCDSRKEAVGEGLIAGAIGIIPAILLLVCEAGCATAVLGAEVPVTAIFDALQCNWLYILFEIVLFGTLIETGTGFIKAVDDRIEVTLEKSNSSKPAWVRPVIAVVSVIIGICVAQFGLTGLIAKGYGTACWGFFIFFVVPMLTLGIYKVVKATKKA